MNLHNALIANALLGGSGGSGGDLPQLNAPTISVSSNAQGQSLIAISNPSTNGNFVTKYKIYLDGTFLRETTSTSGNAITDLGSHSVTVTACGTDFEDSAASNAVTVNNYAITVSTTDCVAVVGNPTQISNNGATATLYFTPDTGLEIRRASFTVSGASIVSASKINGSVTIGSATGAVSIAVEGLEPATAASITVDGLGSENPSSVTFTEEGEFDWDFAEVTDANNNIFIQIPTMYRKINTITDAQITSFTLSDKKIDATYEPYPCFVDGANVLPYVLIGKYCCSSTSVANSVNANYATQTLQVGRTNARALGTGYQLYDWQFQKLFVDLAMCHKKNVNFNSGQTINEYLGIAHLAYDIWVDGFYHNNETWYAALDPSDYVSNPGTHPPTGYTTIGFTAPTSNSQCIKKLGYDANDPFFNQPSELTGATSYTVYYCDRYNYSAGSLPVYSRVGFSDARYGLWYCYATNVWSYGFGVRLCKKPLAA